MGSSRQERAQRRFARRHRLRYVSEFNDGITRSRRGRGFSFVDAAGRPVVDREQIKRLRALAVPPTWSDVWISPHQDAHILAVGRDARGRLQYIYHPRWHAAREAANFDALASFGSDLPALRREVERALRRREPCRNLALALAVRLLDLGLIRVGNAEYATDNDTFGVTTLRKRHARIEGDRIVLEFVGKGSKHRLVDIRHRQTARALSRCAELPGYTLLQFVDEAGRRQRLSSTAVNDFLESHARPGVSAKDFRTWGGTAHAVSLLVSEPRAERESARTRQFNAAVRATAQRLGNTPVVCRRHYVHPALAQAFSDGTLEELWRGTRRGRGRGALSRVERVTLKLAKRGLR